MSRLRAVLFFEKPRLLHWMRFLIDFGRFGKPFCNHFGFKIASKNRSKNQCDFGAIFERFWVLPGIQVGSPAGSGMPPGPPRRSKTLSRRSQDAPKTLKDANKAPQDAPRGPNTPPSSILDDFSCIFIDFSSIFLLILLGFSIDFSSMFSYVGIILVVFW